MRLLDRIANDPFVYAARLFVLAVVLIVAISYVYAQEEFAVVCRDGFCTMKESDLDRLQSIINAMVDRILELQAKTGCT